MHSIIVGKVGEHHAIKHLLSQKYLLIKLNFHTKFGEIDITAFDYTTKEIAFLEVKTSTYSSTRTALQNFSIRKYYKILRSVYSFRNKHPKYARLPWRIDLITIQLKPNLSVKTLLHHKRLEYA